MPYKDPSAHREKILAARRRYYQKHKEKMSAECREYYAANRSAVIAQKIEYGRRHPERVNARNAKRHAARLQRTPVWADYEWINHAYLVAADMTAKMGEPHEVDHIVPLQGARVSGLHVYDNLQILTRSQNTSKGNRY